MTPREYLNSRLMHGIKLGLDNIRFLAGAAGAPHARFPSVHVAGTNGKGSVVAMLDAMFRAAGYCSGRFTSPHLIDVAERYLIDGTCIDDDALDRHITFFRKAAESMPHSPTYFEVATAVAYRHFAERRVDVAVFEVGMGGRFDSTNIITPEAAAITNIDLEHTKYLGDTLEKIAFEKAGILKKGVPVVVAETRPGPLNVILERAGEFGCPVSLLGRDFRYTVRGDPFALQFSYESETLSLGPVPLQLHGTYQGANAAVAVALAERLREKYPGLDPSTIATGIETARWPCRLEQVLDSPPVIIDTTHTAAGARELVQQVPQCAVVLAVSEDKNAADILAALDSIADPLILSQFNGARAMPVDTLSAAAGDRPHYQTPDLDEAIRLALDHASDSVPALITGSVFTAGEARNILINRYGAPPLRF